MRTIIARNVNSALSTALFNLLQNHELRDSRNGPVMAFPYPVLTEYTNPRERVLFSPLRDANPCFHLMESLWMLAGRKDVKFVATFVKRMAEFSDDGTTLWGAYGWRWRDFFKFDQLQTVIDELKVNPTSRRCVVQMWNAHGIRVRSGETHMTDLHVATTGGKDVPCNTALYFDMRDGRMNMTITCRSNDIVWGAYGANAVHMSMLLEYMAAAVGVPVGRMWQFSNDLHLYTNVVPMEKIVALATDVHESDHYSRSVGSMVYETNPAPLVAEGEAILDFNQDLTSFFDAFDKDGVTGCACVQYETQFFNFVVVPMLDAWYFCKLKLPVDAQRAANIIGSMDWRRAMLEWLGRRA